MKITIQGSGFEDFDLESYAEGVSSFLPEGNSGKYHVKDIKCMGLAYGSCAVYCELLPDDPHLHANQKPAGVVTTNVAAPEVVEITEPTPQVPLTNYSDRRDGF
jgi:hypothetical protein